MKIRVRSIFTKIVLWFVATVLLSLIGFIVTSAFMSDRLSGRASNASRLTGLFLEDARRIYEDGGPAALSAYLDRLKANTEADYFLTDGHGIDLVTGEDRSALRASVLTSYRTPLGRYFPRSARAVRIRRSRDGRYRLVSIVPPPARFDVWESLEHFLWLPVLIAILCYLLAVHLATPLRNLRRVVERFGRGELGARSEVTRQDEIGQLARAFNLMAGQIATLLSAERRLLQDVSHELRSPLARLGFAVELAKTSSDREGALARIRQEADRLAQLVDELLQITRAEGDPTARNLQDVELDDLVRELVASCNLEAEAQRCRLSTRIGGPAVIAGDYELLRRACENVLRNAIRHAPEGSSVDVELSTDDRRATITFRDFGPGVPADALPEIFKAFYRVETDRGRSSGGVGLGLAIASRSVALHHGQITARNANPGLLVEIELPLVR